jgi:ribosomal protein S27AE
MVNYQNGKIYEVICSETGKKYIGSTTRPLSQRIGEHRKPSCQCLTRTFINPKIYLIENTPCNSKEELHAIERKFIKKTECVNYYIPQRNSKEYYQDNKETIRKNHKEWLNKNVDTVKEKKRQNRKDNNEEYKKKDNEIYQNNKEVILERRKKYYEENKEKIQERRKEKFNCDCGGKYLAATKARHLKTQKHINYLSLDS